MSLRIVIRCPHCKSRAIARNSREMSDTLREITYQCDNVECGHTYVANLEVVRTLSPSAIPANGLVLHMSPVTQRRIMQQLELLG